MGRWKTIWHSLQVVSCRSLACTITTTILKRFTLCDQDRPSSTQVDTRLESGNGAPGLVGPLIDRIGFWNCLLHSKVQETCRRNLQNTTRSSCEKVNIRRWRQRHVPTYCTKGQVTVPFKTCSSHGMHDTVPMPRKKKLLEAQVKDKLCQISRRA